MEFSYNNSELVNIDSVDVPGTPLLSGTSAFSNNESLTQLVVIDSEVENYMQLTEGLAENASILVLDEEVDGILQIDNALRQVQALESLHIVSHGSSGSIQLGAAQLNADTLSGYAQTLEQWESMLTDTADILIYGCNVAQDQAGKTFLDQFAQLTGADVAASTDITGSSASGGDWQLEHSVGTIEAALPFAMASLAEFDGTLLPPGFENQLVIGGLTQPIALENISPTQMVVAFRDGLIQTFDPTKTVPTLSNYLTLEDVYNPGGKEVGLLDIKTDTDGYLYTYYTKDEPGTDTGRARISRFNMNNANPAEELVWEDPDLVESPPFHLGGSIDFGPDDKIWLTTGDKFKQVKSPDLSLAAGKVIRVGKDGTIPDGTDGTPANPYAVDGDSNTLDSIWASGLRNPFRASWDLETERFFFGDVGGNDNNGTDASWEEINVVTLDDGGATYGWPSFEGPAGRPGDPEPPANYIDPIFSWQHDEAGAAVIGGVVYRGTGQYAFPAEYQGAYFFADFVPETIEYIQLDANGDVIGGDSVPNAANGGGTGGNTVFDTDVGAAVGFENGLDGALYYLDVKARGSIGNNQGAIRRIIFDDVNGNSPPVITSFTIDPTAPDLPAVAAPDILNVSPGQTIEFTVVADDPNSDPLTYEWDFDRDGTVDQTTTVGTTTFTYNNAGSFQPLVVVSDGTSTDRSDDGFDFLLQVGAPPTVNIISVTPNGGVIVDGNGDPLEVVLPGGQQIIIEAEAIDPDDGVLTGASLDWSLDLFHNDHNHPDASPDEIGTTLPFMIDVTGHGEFGNTFYTLTVTATDSTGLTASDSITVTPDESISTFTTLVSDTGTSLPGVGFIKLDGQPLGSDPFLYDNVINFQTPLQADAVIIADGARYEFVSWFDGTTTTTSTGIIAINQATDTTYTANYDLVNYLPDAVNDDFAIPEQSGSTTLDVLANDMDLDSTPLELVSFTPAANGTVIRDDKNTPGDTTDDELIYTPDAGFVGVDTFTYTVQDPFGDTDTATVLVQVGDPPITAPVRDGLVLELDANRGVTASGDTVTAWNDQSGSGNDLTGAGDPQLAVDALNGNNVIQFDTSGDKLTRTLDALSNLPTGDSERSVFMVTKYNENGFGGFGYGKTSNNNAFGLNVDAEGELMIQGWSSADMLTTVQGTNEGWLTQAAIVSANPSGAAAEVVTHYKDGTEIDSQERNFNTILQTLVVGSNLKGTNSLDMEIAEILVYDKALSGAERQQTETYLQQKYGLSGGDPGPGPQQPDAVDDTFEVSENSALNTLNVLENDSDPNNDPLSITTTNQPTNGTVSINGGAGGLSLLYTPDENYVGTDTFTYTVSDGTNTDTATVAVTVTGSTGSGNTPPTAVDDAFTVVENTTDNSLNVLVNDTDADIDPGALDFTTYETITTDSVLRTQTFRHLLSGGGLDDEAFVFDATTGGGADAHFHMMGGMMTSNFLTQHNTGGNGEIINFSFSREDAEAFAFEGFSYTSGEFFPGTNAEFTVIGNLASGGTISQIFGPATTETSYQSVTLDGAGWKNITSVNFVGSVATTGTTITQELNIDDLVVGAAVPLTVTGVGAANDGTAAVNADSSGVEYTPTTNFVGTDTFTYTVSDGIATDTATVTVTVEDDGTPPPTGESFYFGLVADQTLNGTFIANEDIAEFDGTDFSLFFDGSDVGLSGKINGFDVMSSTEILMSFLTTVTLPGAGEVTDGDIVKFTATSLGDNTAGSFEMYFDGSLAGLTAGIDALSQLPDGSLLISTDAKTDVPVLGQVRDEDILRFTPTTPGDNTSGTWSMYVDGGEVSLGTFAENIDAVGVDASGSLVLSTQGNFDVTTVAGADEDVFAYTPSSPTTGTYNPDLFFDGSEFGLGGNDIAGLDIASSSAPPSNNSPNAVEDNFSTDEDTILSDSVLTNDSDPDVGDTLTATEVNGVAADVGSQVTLGSGALLTLNGDGTFVYDPNEQFESLNDGESATDSFTYTISDGNGGTDTATVTITIDGVTDGSPSNQLPNAVDDMAIVDEDTSVIVDVLGNDLDPDNDPLTVDSATDSSNGLTTVNADGTVTYTPNADFNGTDEFTYTISDGNGGTSTATVTVTVNGVNDTPTASNDSFTTTTNNSITFALSDLLANDSDVDGDSLSLDTLNQPENGVLTDNQDGTYTYQPNVDYVGTDTFAYLITDGVETAQAEISIAVSDVPSGGPLPTAGLVLQLDADQGVSTNGTQVTAWADQSGLGNDLTAGGNPQLAADLLNGHSVIQFDTSGDKLERDLESLSGLPAGDSERSVFMVAKYNETGYGGFGYGKTGPNKAFGLNVDAEGELMVQGWSSADMLTDELGTGQGWLSQSAIVAADPNGGSAEQVTHYKDGTLIDTQSRNFNTVLDTLVVGANLKGLNSIDMEVAEILVYDRALSESERLQVEAYFQQKYFS